MRYLSTFGAMLLAILTAYAASAIAIDEFGVFHGASTGTHTLACVPNARAVKARYVERHPDLDAFVLGSSRADSYRVSTLRATSGQGFYNLSSPMEDGLGKERWIRWLLAHHHVRSVVLTLDYDLEDYRNDADPFVRDPPELTGQPRAVFLAGYLLTPPDQLARCVVAQRRGSTYRFDVETGEDRIVGGRLPLREPPHAIEPLGSGRTTTHVEHLAATIAMLRAAHVTTKVVINPVFAGRFRTFRPQTYEQWFRDVVRITGGVWDFSGVNPVTANFRNYFDEMHFTADIGDRVIARIYGRSSSPFGEFVTPASVQERIAALDASFSSIDLAQQQTGR